MLNYRLFPSEVLNRDARIVITGKTGLLIEKDCGIILYTDENMQECVSVPTGNSVSMNIIKMPWLSISFFSEPSYLTYDTDIKKQYIGEVWFPVWTEKTTYQEILVENKPRNLAEAKAEAGALAMQNLLFTCTNDDEIIDKALNFSMIEGDTIQATATAEIITDIGIFSLQISK